jgi:DNA repair exonuclease SbcCD ATPase subunit
MSSERREHSSYTAQQGCIMHESHAVQKNTAHQQHELDSLHGRLAAAEDRAKTAEQTLVEMQSKLDEATERLKAQRASATQEVAEAQARCEQVLRSLRASDEQLKAKETEIRQLKGKKSSPDRPESSSSSRHLDAHAAKNIIRDADLRAENACLIAENAALLTEITALKERLMQEKLGLAERGRARGGGRERARSVSQERKGPRGGDWDEDVDPFTGVQGDAWREREQILSRERVTSLIRERDRLRSQVERLEAENEEWQQELNTIDLVRLQTAATKSDANVQSLLENEVAKSQALQAEILQQVCVFRFHCYF